MRNRGKRILTFFLAFIIVFMELPMDCVCAAVQLDSQTIADYANRRVGSTYPSGYCLRFVEESYQDLGADRPYNCCAYKSGSTYIVSTGRDNIPIGATVYFGNCGGGPCKRCGSAYYGHVGIYVGNGYFVHATGGKVQKSAISSWSNKYRGWGYCGGFFLRKEENNHIPMGHLDEWKAEYGKLWVYGWAFDEDNYGSQVEIHVYLGDAQTGTLIGYMAADQERIDVGNAYPGAGKNHGFSKWINLNITGRHKISVYAIDVNNPSYNRLLGCPEVDFPSKPDMVPTSTHVWVSDSKMGNVPKSYRSGETYYLCYELLDKNTGKRYEAPNGVSYQMKETIYAPDGSIANTCTYNNNNNWIAVQARQAGTYRGVVEISGDAVGKCEVSFTIPKVSSMQLHTWTAKSPRGGESGTFKQGTYCYLNYELLDKDTQKKWDDLCASDYQVQMTVYNPDGSVLDSETYHDDEHYLSCQVQKTGIYKCAVKISGDWSGQWEDTFEVLPQTEKGLYYGDLNHDGKISITDVSGLNQAAQGQITLPDDDKKRADLDGDGKVTEKDVELLRDFYLGIITEFPIEKMLTQIVITRAPDKTSYYVGDVLSTAGMKVEAVYGNFTTKEIKNYKVSGSASKAGTQDLTISYTEGGVTKKAVQKIEVMEKHVHNYASRVTREATCTTVGIRTYTCTCGASYMESLGLLGHRYVKDMAKEPACTSAGKTEGGHCGACGTVLKVQTTIPATGHTWDAGKVTKQPSAAKEGVRTYTCDVCKAVKTEPIPATGMQGHTHSYTSKITKTSACTSEGEKTYTCACGDSYVEQIPKKQHIEVEDRYQAATCTSTGKTEGSHCAVCGTMLKNQTVIPMTGHQNKAVRNAKKADCGKEGYTGDIYCQDCGEKLSGGEPIKQKDHVWNHGIVIKAATETKAGVKSYTCQLCGRTKQEAIPIAGAGKEPEGESVVPDRALKAGDIILDKAHSGKYKVLWADADEIEVEYISPVNPKASSIKVPDKIETADGIHCEVTVIAEKAFVNNKYLKKAVVGNNVRVIGQKAFYGCSKLNSLQLGKRVADIRDNAFRKCSSLKKLTLPASISRIGSNAFSGCKKLKMLQVKSMKLSAASMDKKAFVGVSAKASVRVPRVNLKTYRKLFRQKGLPKKAKILSM